MYKRIFKRFFDITFSSILIILFSLIMLVLVILIKRDGGPAVFVQERSGKGNRRFKIYKFRTMTVDNDSHNFKEENKITPFGKFLRDTSLDELPQLFNVLKGEMSFIGPRPWMTDYSMYFNGIQMHRLDVLPGITGLAQCNGRNNINIQEKIAYDLCYVKNMSLRMDISIILKTIMSVLTKDGVSSSKLAMKSELDQLKEQDNFTSYDQSISLNDEIDGYIGKMLA